MIPYHIANQFQEKIQFLVHSYYEARDGKLPSKELLREEVLMVYTVDSVSPEIKIEVFVKDTRILQVKIRTDDLQCSGYFECTPELMNNEFVQKRLNEWKT